MWQLGPTNRPDNRKSSSTMSSQLTSPRIDLHSSPSPPLFSAVVGRSVYRLRRHRIYSSSVSSSSPRHAYHYSLRELFTPFLVAKSARQLGRCECISWNTMFGTMVTGGKRKKGEHHLCYYYVLCRRCWMLFGSPFHPPSGTVSFRIFRVKSPRFHTKLSRIHIICIVRCVQRRCLEQGRGQPFRHPTICHSSKFSVTGKGSSEHFCLATEYNHFHTQRFIMAHGTYHFLGSGYLLSGVRMPSAMNPAYIYVKLLHIK